MRQWQPAKVAIIFSGTSPQNTVENVMAGTADARFSMTVATQFG